MKKFSLTEKGFSLVELMIAIAVLSIISMIAVPRYSEYIQQGRLATAKSMLMVARQALQEEYLKTGVMPDTFGENTPPNGTSDYAKYFTVSIADGNLVTTPVADNNYDGFATLSISSGEITYTCVKYPGACRKFQNR